MIWKTLSAGFQSSNFSAITPMYLRNLDVGSGMMTEIDYRFRKLEQRVPDMELNPGGMDPKAFRSWYVNEPDYIYALLKEMETAVDRGALPATENTLKGLKGEESEE